MTPIPGNLYPCRSTNCARMVTPNTPDAIPAASVLKRTGVRGWYCPPCALFHSAVGESGRIMATDLTHEPITHATDSPEGLRGVRCTCGADFYVNLRLQVVGVTGVVRWKTLKSMDMCWDQYRNHWGTEQARKHGGM